MGVKKKDKSTIIPSVNEERTRIGGAMNFALPFVLNISHVLLVVASNLTHFNPNEISLW